MSKSSNKFINLTTIHLCDGASFFYSQQQQLIKKKKITKIIKLDAENKDTASIPFEICRGEADILRETDYNRWPKTCLKIKGDGYLLALEDSDYILECYDEDAR